MAQHDLDKALAHVSQSRRTFFRSLFVGAAVAAVPLVTTQAMAQAEGADPGPGGTCDSGLVVSKKTGKCAMPKKKKAD
jgi:hypothetical protein